MTEATSGAPFGWSAARRPQSVRSGLHLQDAGPFGNNPLPSFGEPSNPSSRRPGPVRRQAPPTWQPQLDSSGNLSDGPFGSPGGALLGTPGGPVPSQIDDLRPRLRLLVAAVAIPACAAVLLVLHGWYWNVLGWALASFGSLGLVFWFTIVDQHDRGTDRYRGNDSAVAVLRVVAPVLGLLVAVCHAWLFATWLARLDVFA